MQGTKNLTKGPINRQLFNLAIPIMATSFIQMAYSLTDMAWVGPFRQRSSCCCRCSRYTHLDVRFHSLAE